MNLGMGKILEIGLAAFRREEDIALAPEDNGLRLMLPQERLPLGIKLNVGPVVVEEIKLDALGSVFATSSRHCARRPNG